MLSEAKVGSGVGKCIAQSLGVFVILALTVACGYRVDLYVNYDCVKRAIPSAEAVEASAF